MTWGRCRNTRVLCMKSASHFLIALKSRESCCSSVESDDAIARPPTSSEMLFSINNESDGHVGSTWTAYFASLLPSAFHWKLIFDWTKRQQLKRGPRPCRRRWPGGPCSNVKDPVSVCRQAIFIQIFFFGCSHLHNRVANVGRSADRCSHFARLPVNRTENYANFCRWPSGCSSLVLV